MDHKSISPPNWVHGVPYLGLITEDSIKQLTDHIVYDDDIYVAGYPKSGLLYLVIK